MNAGAPADKLPVSALGRSPGCEPREPTEGHRYRATVSQFDDQRVEIDLDVFGARGLSCQSRSSHATPLLNWPDGR